MSLHPALFDRPGSCHSDQETGDGLVIRELLEFVEIPMAGTEAAMQAIGFPMNDYIDALQAAAALAFGGGFIVTRNIADYRRSPVPAISPAEFMIKADPFKPKAR